MDGASGRPVPFFDSGRILWPSYVPAGYEFDYAAPNGYELFGYEDLAAPQGSTVSCSQLYSRFGLPDMLLVVTQATGGRLEWPAGTRAEPVTVRGHRALTIPGRISWTQDGQTIVVFATNRVLRMSELIKVADSVGDGGAPVPTLSP
jgi:hypothetical protein